MKSSRQRRIRPLKAKAATADAAAEFENYGAEPNMKLSHAFMVVLALHVIAVGGLFAFNKVKAGHSKVSEKLQAEVASGQEAVMKEESKPLVPVPVPAALHQIEKQEHQVAKTVEPPVTQQKLKEPVASSVPVKTVASAPTTPVLSAAQKAFLATKKTTTSASSSSGAVAAMASMASTTATTAAEPVSESVSTTPAASIEYTIIKGDNPYKIAKRFHVPYDQLIKFNNISDPRKMQIGQKIRIPKKK